MTEKDITRISVGNFSVSIIGLKQVLNEIGASLADKPDEQAQAALLERLEKDNYIPDKSRPEYGKAFVRELRKFLGQPYADDAPKGLDIKVLGAGCNQCRYLTQLVMEVLTELKMPAGVDHITDFKEIARYGVMGSPVLLINRKVVAVGSVPPRDRIKKWLLEAGGSRDAK
jgi:hypothetical protein